MRLTHLVPLLPLATAFVLPDAEFFQQLEQSGEQALDNAQNVLEGSFGKVKDTAKTIYTKIHHTSCDVESWLEGSSFDDATIDFEEGPHPPFPPPHGPPPDGPPPHGPPPHGPPPHDPPPHGPPPHGPPPHHPPHHGRPHRPPHHEKPNRTVYELINESKYTTKLAKLINKFDDLVELLNGTEANYTIFAPTDKAFEKIPHHGKKPTEEMIKALLTYHVSPEFYPAGRLFHSYTIPTLLQPQWLGHNQRLTFRMTLKGPVINFYSKILKANIFGTNGVIHGVDSIILPPPKAVKIIDLLPGEFSTLELALHKTGLYDKLNDTTTPHEGGTFFAPSNFAFKKLGVKANAFLFSRAGERILKALVKYHVSPDHTLYTDAYFGPSTDESFAKPPPYWHFDLPTLFDDRDLAIDVKRYGPFVGIKINGFARVTIHDGVARDGVIQVVSDVLIPPRKTSSGEQVFWQGEELSVGELEERFAPYVEENWEL